MSDLNNILGPDSLKTIPGTFKRKISLESLVRNHSNQFEMSELHSLAEKSSQKKHALKST